MFEIWASRYKKKVQHFIKQQILPVLFIFRSFYYHHFVTSCPKLALLIIIHVDADTKPAHCGLTPAEAKEKASAMKRELLEAISNLGDNLPANTLDELVDSLGGSDKVAEVRSSYTWVNLQTP